MYWTGKSGETLRARRYCHRSKAIVSQHISALLDMISTIGIRNTLWGSVVDSQMKAGAQSREIAIYPN